MSKSAVRNSGRSSRRRCSEIVVFIDDYPSTVGANEWTWYEGVSYGPPPRAECDADWNGDASVDFFDVLDYLTVYDEGCE